MQHPAYRSMAFQVEGRVENSFGGTCILRARVQFQRCVKEPHVKAGISENVRHLGSWQGENGDKRVRNCESVNSSHSKPQGRRKKY